MTETELTIPMKFDETKITIISTNLIVAANIVGSMASYYWLYEKPSNTPHGCHLKVIKDVTNFIFEGALT